MVEKTPIYCPNCKKLVGYQEDYMFMVLKEDIKCTDCGTVVIFAPQVRY